MKTSRLPTAILIFYFILIGALSIRSIEPPAPLTTSAPPDQFSALRAFTHVQAIAAAPHPVETPAHAAVRDYIRTELSKLGLDAQVQKADMARGGNSATIENIIARLPGSAGGGKAILLVAHYDSVPYGPGASDDGSAVAALLETARALKAGSPLHNDVIFLFTDGEEEWLLGAAVYAEQHPWISDTGLVLNFEGRGNHGPVYMFETSPENAWLIGEFAKAVPYPVTNSLMYEVYRQLPNDTDFTIFKDAGYPGLNFAFIDGLSYYHGPQDTPENMSLASLQHDGSYALSLARHFGSLDLATASSTNAIYFNVGKFLVVYPEIWALPLAVLGSMLFLGVLVLGLRKKLLSLWKTGAGGLAFLLVVVVLAGVSYLFGMVVYSLLPEFSDIIEPANSIVYRWALVFIVSLLGAALLWIVRRWIGAVNLAVGALLVWLALNFIVLRLAPGASFVTTWPLLSGLIGMCALFFLGCETRPGWPRYLVLAIFSIPALVLVVPLIDMLGIAMGMRMLVIPGIVTALLLGLLVSQLSWINLKAEIRQ